MPLETTPFDILDYLDSDEEQAAYLQAAIEEDDPSFIAVALGDIARVRGLARFAVETGLPEQVVESEFRHGGAPSIQTVSKATRALGLKLKLVAA